MENGVRDDGDSQRSKKASSCFSSSMSSFSFWSIFSHADAVDRFLMALGFVGAVGDGLSLPILFVINNKIYNDMGAGPSASSSSSEFLHKISKSSLNMVYVACGTIVMWFLEGYCWTRTAERQASRMRARYLKAVLRQDVEYFDLHISSSADVITSISSDSLVIQDVISEKVPNFVMNATTFLGFYVASFFLLWELALVAFPTAMLIVISSLIYGRRLKSLATKIREEYIKANAVVEQAVSSIRTVYSFAAETHTMAKFSAALDDSIKLGLQQGLAKGLAMGSSGINYAIWAFVVWYGSHLVMYHGAKGGTVYVVGASLIIGGQAIGLVLPNLKYFAEASSAAERIMKVIRRIPKIDLESKEGDVLSENMSGNVEFKAVRFAYPSRPENPILRDINLKVPAGRSVALVGSSSSGKSTVIALLQRFYDPQGGEILLDGVDVRKLNLKWLRSQMGLVSQEPALFATSVKENILFGKEEASMEEVVAAAKAANAHDFISHLPHGYNTQVGERGVQMSGGQKQRIAIARAVLRSPRILLLDEATSALDIESERVVQVAINMASVGRRTTIVIAHRLSTVRNADAIAVVQAGQIMEVGSHNDLICDEQGLYSSLFRLQHTAKEEEEEEEEEEIKASVPFSQFCSSNNMSCEFPARRSLENPVANKDVNQLKLQTPSFRRLLMLNTAEWKHALLGSLSAVVFSAFQPVCAFVLGGMISVYFSSDHNEIKSRTRTFAFIFIVMSALSFLINVVQHYNFGATGEYLTKRVREEMLSKILTFEVGWFDQDENSTGAICSRLASDANVVRSLVGDHLSLIIQAASAIVIAFTMGLAISWRLALVITAGQPIIIVSFYARLVLLKKMSTKAINAQSESSKLAVQAVYDLRTITAFSSQDRIFRLFKAVQEGPKRESIRQSWYAGICLACSQSFVTCTFALYFWYGGKLISEGDISAKAFYQTYSILVSTGRLIAETGSMTTEIARGAHTVASVFQVLDRSTSIEPEDPKGSHPKKLAGNIDIERVDFAFPTRPSAIILRDFSLGIEAGKSTALVGQSGSGKSTIIGLIERFYDPLRGTIKIDGKDIKSYNLRSLRRQIGLVGQEPSLFAGTIRENIKYGTEWATEQEVEDAARASNAHDFISSLKDGYNTQCGDRGLQLSGGQKQRIAIARVILKNPSILLLDEATSALDVQSEKIVQEALERVMVGRTGVVVAHRLSTIENCHLIVVLDNGTVAEKGTHASLLAKGPTGSYYGIVSLQHNSSSHLIN